jgi:hypothetical protein
MPTRSLDDRWEPAANDFETGYAHVLPVRARKISGGQRVDESREGVACLNSCAGRVTWWSRLMRSFCVDSTNYCLLCCYGLWRIFLSATNSVMAT